MKTQPIGFFALWRNNRSEYHADDVERDSTLFEIQNAFNATVENGTKIFTQFETRWSTERQYFAYWESPSFEVLEEAMNDLEKAGDFKFAESEHIIGKKIDDDYSRDVLPDVLNERQWLGCFIAWKWTSAFYKATPTELAAVQQEVQTLFEYANKKGIEFFGQYESRYCSKWDRFIYLLLPTHDLLEDLIEKCEKTKIFHYIESRHVLGIHNPNYRFSREFQN
jgi:hypothetical protein